MIGDNKFDGDNVKIDRKQFGQRLWQRIQDRYKQPDGKKTRKKDFATEIGVSQSTVSQWISGAIIPSVERLVNIATELDDSLDYLLLGKDIRQTTLMAPDPWIGHIDRSLHYVLYKTHEHMAAYERIARILSDQISAAAETAVSKNITSGDFGFASSNSMTDEETMVVERFSVESQLILLNMDYNLSIENVKTPEDMPAAGRFAQIVANNLVQGRIYTFILPEGLHHWEEIARQYRQLLGKFNVSNTLLYENCRFHLTSVPIVSGAVFYRLQTELMKDDRAASVLLERLRPFMDAEGWIGYVPTPSRGLQVDALMDPAIMTFARKNFHKILRNKNATKRLG